MKKIIPIVIALACAAPAPLQAFDGEPLLPSDSRIKLLPYDEADIYTITTKFGYQTNIVFESQEEIQTISMGDRSLWQIIPTGHRLFIRPMMDGVTTNMTIITNRRSYQFDLKSIDSDSKNTDIIYVAKFVYGDTTRGNGSFFSPYDDQMSKMPPALPEASTPAPAMTPIPAMPSLPAAAQPEPVAPVAVTPNNKPMANANYNYTYAGPDELAPLQVYDDGKSTYFKYRAMNQPLPNAYITGPDRKETPVAHYIKDGYMVIDDVTGEWMLKTSTGTVMVYNETLNPK